ncbi:hypothetical protein TNCV_2137311 [Trichonephila clavipes]|nr:hypothetical protein TNCV_2137311 [Trichonephila clavipes]
MEFEKGRADERDEEEAGGPCLSTTDGNICCVQAYDDHVIVISLHFVVISKAMLKFNKLSRFSASTLCAQPRCVGFNALIYQWKLCRNQYRDYVNK